MIREVGRLLHSGYTHVVDIDIKGYFDAIPHAPLMQLVKEHIADGRVLELGTRPKITIQYMRAALLLQFALVLCAPVLCWKR